MEYTTTLADAPPIVITIGNFDGIHRGHQQLLHDLRDMANAMECRPVIVTFAPHTLMVLRPDIDVQCLTTLEENSSWPSAMVEIAESIVIHFTREVAAMSAEAFMDELCASFPIRGLLVGEDFSLGRNRMGNVSFLEEYGQRHQLSVRSIPLANAAQERITQYPYPRSGQGRSH